jgi:glycosyltransferase involved in cell wall biosynthesis
VVEYLAAGRPVIYSDQGGLAALVGPAGMGYPPDDVDEVAGCLRTLLGNRALRTTMAAAATRRAGGFDWESVAEAVLAFASGRLDGQPELGVVEHLRPATQRAQPSTRGRE